MFNNCVISRLLLCALAAGCWVPAGEGSDGGDITIDTLPVVAFDAATDSAGNIWVAAAGIDTRVRVYRSTDLGDSWDQILVLRHGTDVPKVEIAVGGGDSSFVYVCFLSWTMSGDLWLMRISLDGSAAQVFPVAVGPDTISDFSIAVDRDFHHYLYCLYANETHAGRNGGFTRSLDFGRSWEVPQDWWNCQDPCVLYSTGSSVHCTWRHAATGRQVHFETNRHYGKPREWLSRHIVSSGTESRWGPVAAQADTSPASLATVWLVHTIAHRDTEDLDLVFAYSTNGGGSWAWGGTIGRGFRDEWFPDLCPSFGGTRGYVHLCYNAGSRKESDKTAVYCRTVSMLDPGRWSAPVQISDRRVNAVYEQARPRIVCPAGAPRNLAGVIFSYYHPDYARGLYFDAVWRQTDAGDTRAGSVVTSGARISRLNLAGSGAGVEIAIGIPGRYTLEVFDALGRRVKRLFAGWLDSGPRRFYWDGSRDDGLCVRSGTYFVHLAGPGSAASSRFVLFHR